MCKSRSQIVINNDKNVIFHTCVYQLTQDLYFKVSQKIRSSIHLMLSFFMLNNDAVITFAYNQKSHQPNDKEGIGQDTIEPGERYK